MEFEEISLYCLADFENKRLIFNNRGFLILAVVEYENQLKL